jgi:hypothetical protein
MLEIASNNSPVEGEAGSLEAILFPVLPVKATLRPT